MFLIMLRSSKSRVTCSWCHQIWDMCGNMFLHVEGQLVDLESHFSAFFPLKSTSEVSQRLKMQFNPIHTQMGGASHFEFSMTSSMEFQQLTDLQHVKKYYHTSQIWQHQLLVTPLLLDSSVMRNIHRVFKFLQYGRTNLLNILSFVVYFTVA